MEHGDATLWADIKLRGHDRLVVGVIYRSPSSTDEQNCKMIDMITAAVNLGSSHILIMGDLNYPGIDWDLLTTNGNQQEYEFIENFKEWFLWQHTDKPTRYREQQKANILDLVLTNEQGMVDKIIYCDPVGKSDHLSLEWYLQCYVEPTTTRVVKYLYHKTDFSLMKAVFRDVRWNELLSDKPVEEQWMTFRTKVSEAIECFIPCNKSLNHGSQHRKPAWMNDRVLA